MQFSLENAFLFTENLPVHSKILGTDSQHIHRSVILALECFINTTFRRANNAYVSQ